MGWLSVTLSFPLRCFNPSLNCLAMENSLMNAPLTHADLIALVEKISPLSTRAGRMFCMPEKGTLELYGSWIADIEAERRPCRYTLARYGIGLRQVTFTVEKDTDEDDVPPPGYITFAGTSFLQVVPSWKYVPFQLVPPEETPSWLERIGIFEDMERLPYIAHVPLQETEVVIAFTNVYFSNPMSHP